ncbi:MAG: DNA topoisomerase VI subunit B [Planctomycetes bacterium]|nr:DNA topoisomerase VI subunit B [Planctomycetota bacterium]
MASKQREISVSEFFAKNRHLLGFDNPRKALLTAVKEAVDNSLDACEEAGILPEISVTLQETAEDRFRMIVQDNGPGIVKQQIPKVFGKLLYGSKFHRLKMSRGQQGIGISAAGMYGQLTTGKPVAITSRVGPGKPAHYFEIHLDTARNQPEIQKETDIDWAPPHGTRVEIELAGRYQRGRASVDDYLFQTAIANPHVTIHYKMPDGQTADYERATNQLPREPKEIKPHPYGVELGVLIKMLVMTKSRNLRGFLTSEFCRVSGRVADEIVAAAELRESQSPRNISRDEADKLHKAMQKAKIMAPPTECISPIGEDLIEAGLRKVIKADFYATVSRPPVVYRGNPFLVEAGIAYGGDLPMDELVRLVRYANRVPLLYQQSACATTEGVLAIDWKNYELQQSRSALPTGPAVLMVHIASVWVPFTSESKEAVADYPEIEKEIKLALQECGRKLASYLRKKQHLQYELKRRSIFAAYAGILAKSIEALTGVKKERIEADLDRIAKKDMPELSEPPAGSAAEAGDAATPEEAGAAAAPNANGGDA